MGKDVKGKRVSILFVIETVIEFEFSPDGVFRRFQSSEHCKCRDSIEEVLLLPQYVQGRWDTLQQSHNFRSF